MSKDRVDVILHFWFGCIEKSILPSPHRIDIWRSNESKIVDEIKTKFLADYEAAIAGQLVEWENEAQSCLALVILLDQFSRKLFYAQAGAYRQDAKALELCLAGVERGFDHKISLIERVFFYMPLMHAESHDMQAISLRAYQMLLDLSFPEARPMFETFLQRAILHFDVIKRFSRFPERNQVLGRQSTEAEMTYLQQKGLDVPTE